MQELANQRGGLCLSKAYINSTTKLLWRCANGHEFQASPTSIKNSGTWCPKCHFFRNEELYRSMFEYIFDTEFKKVRPKFLISKKTGKRMELDGYAPKLKVAFEYNGEQHYQGRFFGDNSKKLVEIKSRDEQKVKACKENKIKLFVIKYDDDIQKIFNDVTEYALQISNITPKKKSLRSFSGDYYTLDQLKECHEIAKNKGGVFLSNNFLGAKRKHTWKCEHGHIWEASVSKIKYGTWCPKCIPNSKKNISSIKEKVEQKNGILLTKSYKNINQSFNVVCQKGHRFSLTGRQILHQNNWCFECKEKFYELQELVDYVEKRNGKLINHNFSGSSGDMCTIQCEKGHEWQAKVWRLLKKTKLVSSMLRDGTIYFKRYAKVCRQV